MKQKINITAGGHIDIKTQKGLIYRYKKYVLLEKDEDGNITILESHGPPEIISLN